MAKLPRTPNAAVKKKEVCKWWGLNFIDVDNLEEFCNSGLQGWSSNQKSLWEGVVKAVAYGIWRCRNDLVFNGKGRMVEDILFECQLLMFQWLKGKVKKREA